MSVPVADTAVEEPELELAAAIENVADRASFAFVLSSASTI